MSNQSILDMNENDAKKYLMKSTSYLNVRLPKYFNFKPILKKAQKILRDEKYKFIHKYKKEPHDLKYIIKKIPESKNNENNLTYDYPSTVKHLNYTLFINENGKYDWVPFTLIHPILYMDLIDYITIPKIWKKITGRFTKFKTNSEPKCRRVMNKKYINHILIKNALKYKFCIRTHIINCYKSVYTHTIAWALETKYDAKHNRHASNAGNNIDRKIEYMQQGQTDGIPKGSKVSNIIIELILSYADYILIKDTKFTDFRLIRYKSYYTIFAHNIGDAHLVLKWLLVVLKDLNMRFNSNDTVLCNSKKMLLNFIKPDKLYQVKLDKIDNKLSIEDELWQIKSLSKRFPNTNSLKTELNHCYRRAYNIMKTYNKLQDAKDKLFSKLSSNDNDMKCFNQIIRIVTYIIDRNPICFINGISLISLIIKIECKYLDLNKALQKAKSQINYIKNDFRNKTHTEYAYLWIQRLELGIKYNNMVKTTNPEYCLYNKVLNTSYSDLWNSKWMNVSFTESNVINETFKDNLNLIISYK